MIVAACEGDAEQPAGTSARGVYVLDGTTGDLLVLSFVDASRYWSWKNDEECRDLSVLRDACEEQGHYAVDGGTLTLTADDGTTHQHSFASASTTTGLVEPKAEGELVGTGQETTRAPSVIVGGSSMTLVRRGVELLTCRARSEGSGAVPGAPLPSSNYSHGSFRSGPFAPGGSHDPRTAASGAPALDANSSPAGHHYALMSDRLPAGTTFDQANAALQRFNAPTGPAVSGRGDDPHSTAGWVVDPLTGQVPVGCATFERGNGWARNTTQDPHPFVGTITRYVVDAGNGSYRILTVGDGVTPPSLVNGARNLANVVGGPSIFRQLDGRLIESLHQ